MKGLGFVSSALDPTIYYLHENETSRNKREAFKDTLKRKTDSANGLIGRSLLGYLDLGDIRKKKLIAMVAVHVGDCIVFGSEELYKTKFTQLRK